MSDVRETTSDAEDLARRFHETYERLAPSFGYQTREATAVPWDQVPERNKQLMIAVSAEILAYLRQQAAPSNEIPAEQRQARVED